MKKTICVLGRKLLLVMLVIVIPAAVSAFAEHFFPEYAMGGGYGRIEAQWDYLSQDHEYNRVLILGDSAAQAAYLPSLLSTDTYNMAIGGGTPVDGYYRLLTYLENHGTPEYLFCSYSPSMFLSQNNIWDTAIYMHAIPYSMAKKILHDAKNYDESTGLIRQYPDLQLFAYYLGVHPESISMSMKAIMASILSGGVHSIELIKHNMIISSLSAVTGNMTPAGMMAMSSTRGSSGRTDILPSRIWRSTI